MGGGGWVKDCWVGAGGWVREVGGAGRANEAGGGVVIEIVDG